MRRTIGGLAGALAACLIHLALAATASAMEVLDAEDHAELAAEVSATEVSRIALAGDRIVRLVRGPGGYAAEHDPTSGDLYLRPPASGAVPLTLYLGTEKGFTYRLTLTPVERGAAQILIRNPAAAAPMQAEAESDSRVGALVALIRAAARREPLPGYAVELDITVGDVDALEVWRGPRFTALVLELGAGDSGDATALAARLGPGIAAAWTSAPGTGPSGGRLAVAVRETALAEDAR